MALARCLSDAGSTCQVPLPLTATPAEDGVGVPDRRDAGDNADTQPLGSGDELLQALRVGEDDVLVKDLRID